MYTSAPLTLDDFYEEAVKQNTTLFGEAAGQVRAEQEMRLLESTFEKALVSQGITPGDGTTGGDALKDHTVANKLAITERRMETEAPLWNRLKKIPHPYDRVEWVRLDSFGGDEYGGMLDTRYTHGGLVESSPSVSRVTTPMGWFGIMGIASLLLTTQRTVGFNGISQGNAEDTIATSNLNNLVLNLDRHSLWGDHTICPLQPNGFIKQTRAAHSIQRKTRINLKGQPLSRELAQHIEAILREKGAMWKEFWMTGFSRADFITQYQDAVRLKMGDSWTGGNRMEDYLISKWNGAEGKAEFLTNNHLKARALPLAFNPNAPIGPATLALTQSANPAGNVWSENGNIENMPAGPSTYKVVARGINGRALPVSAGSINVTSGNKVNLAITKNDAGVVEYEIYAARNATGAGAGYIGRVGAFNASVGDVVNFVDDGEFVPGCDTGFIVANGAIEGGYDEMQICQQFPISKIMLPRQLIAFPFAYAAAMTPQDYTPGYNLILENMGRTTF